MQPLQLAAGLCLLLIFAPGAACQSADEGQATPRESSESRPPQRKLRLNGLGVTYRTKRGLSLDAGYRPGFGGTAGGGIEPQHGFFLGVKKRF